MVPRNKNIWSYLLWPPVIVKPDTLFKPSSCLTLLGLQSSSGDKPLEILSGLCPKRDCSQNKGNPSRAGVSFWGQRGANYLEIEWLVPKTGLEY